MESLIAQIKETGIGGDFYGLWLFAAACLFCSRLEKGPRWRLKAGLFGAALMLLGLLLPSTLLGNHVVGVCLWYIGVWALVCAGCRTVCRISWEEALACGTNAVLLEHIGSSVHILLTAWAAGGQRLNFLSYSMLSYLAVYAVVWLTLGRRLGEGGHLRVNRIGVATLSVMGLTVTVVLSFLFKANVDPDMIFQLADPHAIALLMTGQLYAIFFCITMLALQYAQQRAVIAGEQVARMHELWSIRQRQYETGRENIEMINRKCHDMKHQIAALMAEGGTDGEKQRFSEEIQQLIGIYDAQMNTKNEALNTLLTEKGLYCSAHGIRWTCVVDEAPLAFMDRMDLYVMLGNALDNAIEAVQQIPEEEKRIIQLQISRRDQFACIRLENSTAGRLTWEGELPGTSKADRENHGYGLRSIRQIASEYEGYASVSTEGHAFILSIVMPIPASGEKERKNGGGSP